VAARADSLRDTLNGVCRDLVVLKVEAVDNAFHRGSMRSRRYRYELRSSSLRHPLEDRLAWQVWPPVRISNLVRSGRLVLGTHDFGAFGTASRKAARPSAR
jgi:tRNA U38,U39,U40 pseudouridine synthase TruA